MLAGCCKISSCSRFKRGFVTSRYLSVRAAVFCGQQQQWQQQQQQQQRRRYSRNQKDEWRWFSNNGARTKPKMVVAATAVAAAATTTTTSCDTGRMMDDDDEDDAHLTPSDVASEDFAEVMASHNIEEMPVYTSDEVAQNNGEDGTPIWMSYGGIVYDVTDFIPNHPGGSEKILTAAGSSIEPFWHLYRQHFTSDLPIRLMEHMAIGRLATEDQQLINEQLTALQDSGVDPYANEPLRHMKLLVHSDQPFKAECPVSFLGNHNYITPNSLFFIRNHHPVPYIDKEDVASGKYTLKVDLSAYGKGTMKLSLDDLQKMKKETIVATVQCAGNRRGDFNQYGRTSGVAWGQGAISTAKWGGVRLSTILQLAGLHDPVQAQELDGMEHVRFSAIDGMEVSIGIEKAMSPYGDCLIAYEMNDEPLPRDHGYPLRMIIPGYVGVRNIKWLHAIELSKTQADGPWQHGLNYKMLPPSVTELKGIDLETLPSMNEGSIYSGICSIKRVDPMSTSSPSGQQQQQQQQKQRRQQQQQQQQKQKQETEGSINDDATALKKKKKSKKSTSSNKETVIMKVKGWAYAGGGRNVVRVDITGDESETWTAARIIQGGNQRPGRAWAWVLWECELPCVVHEDGHVYVGSRAVDSAFNVQPESIKNTWNVRGLGNNSIFWGEGTVPVPLPRRRI